MNVLKRAVEISHELVNKVLNKGDIAVDCTMGNGNDTVFLSEIVGGTGTVYSFDIQEVALISTNEKLVANGLKDIAKLILDSHENIDKYIYKPIKCAMYNLGYLPNGDHKIVTKPSSTINSIEKVLGLLSLGGLITIAIYYGHDGGIEEKDAIIEYVSNLNQDIYYVQKFEFLNFRNYPPILIAIEKNDKCI